ncbi:MAG: GDP-mannose 4,6-dehydratase, partial [Atopobiaceae bacterium]|nr:GDP-mannose 4,6-dehydratase [Atopobiaceae bacterium]
LIGEKPHGRPNNLMPYLTQVAAGKLPRLNVFGNDYDTPDGTGVRDYIHVVDLAKGHVCAIKKLMDSAGVKIYNLGTGTGYSVFDIIHAYERACGHELPFVMDPPRTGDISASWADPTKAERVLGWKATRGLDEMCRDSWNWQSNNPEGFGE